MTDPDVSGMLRFLTDELQDAEDAGERGEPIQWSCSSGVHQPHGFYILVWITGHVLSGWDGSNPLMNPTNLFYQMYVGSLSMMFELVH